jgi:hypothetical protein
MLCLVKNSKGTGAILCCSIGEPKCFVSKHPQGYFRVLGGNNRPFAWPCQVEMYLWFSFSSTPFFLCVQVGLILRDFFLHDFALLQFGIDYIFQFNTNWYGRSLAPCILEASRK